MDLARSWQKTQCMYTTTECFDIFLINIIFVMEYFGIFSNNIIFVTECFNTF